MNFENYVNEVACVVEEMLGGGYSAGVTTKDLANGLVTTGIMVKEEQNNIGSVIYLNDSKDIYNSADIENAAKFVVDTYKRTKLGNVPDVVNKLKEFDSVKDLIRVRLYNRSTKAEVFVSAEKYGYEDLIIVPYIDVTLGAAGNGSVKITNKILDAWKITKEEIIEIALNNMREKIEIIGMVDFLQKETGLPREVIGVPECIKIVSTTEHQYGAIGVILAQDQLKGMYKDGYIVLPSSIHECIVVPFNMGEVGENMVQAVNEEVLKPEDVLSSHPYLIK